jgi:CubicO group peptidase (beta-lactamase class C family)
VYHLAMILKSIFTAILLAAIGFTAWYTVTAAPAGAGLLAKQVCSLVYVSGFSPGKAETKYTQPLLGPATLVLRPRVDPVRRQVSVSALGVSMHTAVYQPGVGCIVLHERTADDIETLLPAPATRRPPEWKVNAVHRRLHFDTTALKSALETALAAPGSEAVLVAHDGHIVAEAYAEGTDGDTPLPGWSMSKTVTTVLAGMLVRRGLLATDEVALFKAWENDARIHITVDHLLRMTSGINILENKTGADANSHMLFKTGDAAAYAINRGLREQPGTTFAYTSGSTLLAARIISDRLGGGPAALDFIRRELFRPLDMRRSIFEVDETGQFIGSSFIMSSAHDWARFGVMLQDKGIYDGTRIVDAGWLRYMTTPVEQATERPYGAGVWLVDPEHPDHPWMHALPRDTFYASGLQTNQLWVIPSRKLVIVRLGATSDFFKSGVPDLLNAVLAAQIDPETQSST